MQERTKSILNSKKLIDEVQEDMYMHIIENEVRQEPFISVLSKKQCWWGQGKHFNNAEFYIKQGIMRNMGIRIPKKTEVEKANVYYGYDALIYPWRELNNISNRVMRTKILRATLNGLSDIRVMLGRGYITKEGKLDQNQTKGVSVYVIFLADPAYRDKQNNWISKQDEWVRFQIARNQETHYDILFEKKKSASALVKMNRQLIKQEEYKQLQPSVDREKLPWPFEPAWVEG